MVQSFHWGSREKSGEDTPPSQCSSKGPTPFQQALSLNGGLWGAFKMWGMTIYPSREPQEQDHFEELCYVIFVTLTCEFCGQVSDRNSEYFFIFLVTLLLINVCKLYILMGEVSVIADHTVIKLSLPVATLLHALPNLSNLLIHICSDCSKASSYEKELAIRGLFRLAYFIQHSKH